MAARKELRRDLYQCSILGDLAHIELRYEILTSPDNERLISLDCTDCRKCGVGTRVSAWETKLDWKKCVHPLSPKS